MFQENFGGNKVTTWEPAKEFETTFCRTPYHFSAHNLRETSALRTDTKSCLIYFHSGSVATITVGNETNSLKPGDAFFASGEQVTLQGNGLFFIVGDDSSDFSPHRLIEAGNLEVVKKPWGKEIWINLPTQKFSLKEIHIQQGTKTSLQYHQFKTETSIIFRGSAQLTYKKNSLASNDSVGADDLGQTRLPTGTVIHITPGNLHRLEAISDIVLLEASTNHLDDVIRIQDDSKRSNGRIDSEHSKKN